MSEELWYYTQEGKQSGPVPFSELRELTSVGRLRPDDLVWQPGMASWTPASKVDGLLPPRTSGPPPLAAAAFTPPALAATTGASFEEKGWAFLRDAAEHARRLGRSEDHGGNLPHVRFVERLLVALQRVLSPSFLDQVDRATKRLGHWAYLLAAVLFVVFFVCVAIKTDSVQVFFQQAAIIVPLALVGQFTAVRFLDAGTRLIPKLPSRLFSAAFLQCSGLILLMAALVPVCVGLYTLVKTGNGIFFAVSAAMSVVLAYMGGVCVSPESVNVEVDETAGPGEEALGILSFLMKALLRLSPVVFGVGATAGAGVAVFLIKRLLVDDDTAVLFAVTDGLSAFDLMGWVLALGFAPLLAYLAFVLCHLLIDVLRAILELPPKLDTRQAPLETM